MYHSLLTDQQDERLENALVAALRVIYGGGILGRKLRERADIETLSNRRIVQYEKFAEKFVSCEKFAHWFPLKEGRRSVLCTLL